MRIFFAMNGHDDDFYQGLAGSYSFIDSHIGRGGDSQPYTGGLNCIAEISMADAVLDT